VNKSKKALPKSAFGRGGVKYLDKNSFIWMKTVGRGNSSRRYQAFLH